MRVGVTDRGRYNLAMSRLLITLGVILVVAGLAWPLLTKLGFGRLPGDFRLEREGFTFYFPLTSGLIVSLLVSLILWLLRK
jgi:hypothetical protein